MMLSVASAHDAARPSLSRSPPRRCAAAQASRSGSGQSATGRQRRVVPSEISDMGAHCKAALPDAENRLGIMPGRRRALGAGVEGDGGLDILVSEELPNHFVLPRVAVEEDLAGGVPETMRRHVEP